MQIPIAPLIIFAVSWFFFVLACEPKSRYACLGAIAFVLAIASVFWPHVAPALAVR